MIGSQVPMDVDAAEPLVYICGNPECGAENRIKPGDMMVCTKCDKNLILYKQRTREVVEYEAR